MFSRAVISLLLAFFLAALSEGMPSQLLPFFRAGCYIALGFALISALLSLFEEGEEPAPGELHDSEDVLRKGS